MKLAIKRTYKRLNASSWAEVESYWKGGSHTLEDLSAQYAITTRALQSHFQKHGIHKGDDAAAIKAAAHEAVHVASVDDYAGRLAAKRAAQARTVKNADILENFMMAQVAAAQAEPKDAFRAMSTLKAIAVAAAALERLQVVRTAALNVEDMTSEELPSISIVDLTEDDLEEIKRSHGEDIEEEREWVDDDDENEILTYQ